MKCILIGMPLWFTVGILITFSPEFAVKMGITETISAGKAVMYCYIGLAIGDLGSGVLSQLFKTRKKIVLVFLILTNIFIVLYLFVNHFSPFYFYTMCVYAGYRVRVLGIICYQTRRNSLVPTCAQLLQPPLLIL